MRPMLGVREQIVALCALPLVFLIALFIVAMSLQRIALDSFAGVKENDAVVLATSQAYGALDDLNHGITSYTLHPGPQTLRAYEAARLSAIARFAAVRENLSTDPVARALSIHYASDLDRGIAVLDRYMAYLRAGDSQGARKFAASAQVSQLGSDILGSRAAIDQRLLVITQARQASAHQRASVLETAMEALAAGGIVISLVIALAFGYRTVRRLRQLVENAEHLAKREPSVPIEGRDEIGDVDRATHELARRLEDSLALQLALVPPGLPEAAGLRLDSVYIPAASESRVGGDWYDVFEISDHVAGISIGDVAGHGVMAASTMASLRDAIRVAGRRETSPSKALAYVNRTLCLDRVNSLATALFATFDSANGKLTWAVAGHPPPILVRPDTGVSVLEGQGLVLGIDSHYHYADYHAQLDVGCALVFYTDGLVEAERDYFKGVRALQRAVLDVYADSTEPRPAAAIAKRIFATTAPNDDAALLFVGVTSVGSPFFQHKHTWRLDARDHSSARRVKRAILWKLAGLSAGEPEYAAIELIYGELLANVAMHTPGPATVTLEERDGRALLTFEDQGPAFAPERNGVPDVMSESGRGYWLMSQFAESVAIERLGDLNRITVAVPIARGNHSPA